MTYLALNNTHAYTPQGCTQYAQRRITDIVLGTEYTALEALAGWDGLLADIREFGADSPLTRLRVPLEGPEDDPEDVYNDVPCTCLCAMVALETCTDECHRLAD